MNCLHTESKHTRDGVECADCGLGWRFCLKEKRAMKKAPKQRFQTKWRFVSAKDLTAAIAYWAVRLSPYECPHNLVDAIRALTHRAEEMVFTKPIHRRFGFAKKTEKQIKQMVEALVYGTPELQPWNRCRKGKTPDFIATSIYWGKPHPDRDFIDLHALVLEIMSDFRKEWALEDQAKSNASKHHEHDTKNRRIPAPSGCRATSVRNS